ncbi:MAG: PilZ domain-containing protein [Deltaproteobacteria bacterium]|nr:PilZ domain-containing protein [Deltaproteobacteria bacterium]
MELSSEKRYYERFPCRTPVEWGYFNKPHKYSARMLNYSQTGACFESPQALINGSTIQVRLEAYRAECGSDCNDDAECAWPRLIGLGEVKWCRNLSGVGAQRFGVGVRFHLPVL